MHECQLGELLMTEDQKLHPQNTLVLLFSEQLSCKETCGLVTTARRITSPFSYFQSPSPHNPPTPQALARPASLAHKYSKPLAFQDLRFVPLPSCLADSWINLFSAANLHTSAFCLLWWSKQIWMGNSTLQSRTCFRWCWRIYSVTAIYRMIQGIEVQYLRNNGILV